MGGQLCADFGTRLADREICAARMKTYWSTLKCLFSTPAWLTLMRSTAMTRSSGVRNHAVAGESGKKNLMRKVRMCQSEQRRDTPEDDGDD